MFRHSLAIALLFILASVGTLTAQVPQLISYQGRIVANQVNFDGTGQFKFALVNTEGSTSYWSNDGSSAEGSEPETAVALPVSKGLYSVLLGDATKPNMTILPATVFTHGDVHLRVWFNDGVHGFQQLSPDRRIAAVGYAMMAETVADGSITSTKLADGAVTSEKLASGVVQMSNLALGAVGNAQLANASLTINAGTGLTGGGQVSLGGSIALSNTGVLSLTGGNGITVDAASGAVTLGSSAASANTPGAIVARDASGNFSAGTITGSLNGNATTATSAASFTGELTGDVTGTQAVTVITATTVTGKALTGFSAAAGSITASDTLLSAIGKLDGNAALKAPLASPTFTGSVTLPAGNATTAPLVLQSGVSLTTPIFGAVEFDGTNLFITNNSESPTRKTVAYTDSIITTAQIEEGSVTTAKLASEAVGSAQLAAGLTLGGTTSGSFNGSLTGNVTGNVSGSAASFTGNLTGDVTGTQSATVVSTVGGISAANVAAGTTLANNASATNTPSTIVRRDASGNLSAGIISATLNGNAATATTAGSADSFTGSLVGDVTGTQGATVVSSVGGVTAANLAAGANLANTATTANTPNTIVKRDASGNIPASAVATTPPGMILIPAGTFTMGNSVSADTDITNATPVSTTVSAFYMDVNEVTLSQWQSVYYWATSNGYSFTNTGAGKGANHPVQTVDWYDCVKWCNARSEQEGKMPVYYTNDAQTTIYKTGNVNVTNAQVKWNANGYRLPTEAEWEKAARGGRIGLRFPWGDTITQNLSNYNSDAPTYAYDLGPNGYNSIGSVGGIAPATSPVGSFAANGYGLNDMSGNIREWCWDWYGVTYAGGTDPHGPATGSLRVNRGGSWNNNANFARCATRHTNSPGALGLFGFRTILPAGQP